MANSNLNPEECKNEKITAAITLSFLCSAGAIAAIVHPSNPVGSLSLAQLTDIFSTKVSNWKAVGGADLPIEVLITGSNSATNKVFKKMVLQGGGYKGKIVKPDAKIVKLVSSKKGGIGQISFAFIVSNSAVNAVQPDGQEVTTANPDYLITRPLNLVAKDTPQGETKKFIDGNLLAEGQPLRNILLRSNRL